MSEQVVTIKQIYGFENHFIVWLCRNFSLLDKAALQLHKEYIRELLCKNHLAHALLLDLHKRDHMRWRDSYNLNQLLAWLRVLKQLRHALAMGKHHLTFHVFGYKSGVSIQWVSASPDWGEESRVQSLGSYSLGKARAGERWERRQHGNSFLRACLQIVSAVKKLIWLQRDFFPVQPEGTACSWLSYNWLYNQWIWNKMAIDHV